MIYLIYACRALRGRTSSSLVAHKAKINSLKNLKEAVEEMKGLHCGASNAKAMEGVADRAQSGSGSATASYGSRRGKKLSKTLV